MDHMHIGELARRAGLTVKTVRYYSDLGLVPEAARTAAGYRRYDGAAVVRLEFVRTLRELGIDLATIRRLLEREADLPAVAAAHADALGAQIRLMRVQRAALRALARGQHSPREVERMSRLAQATAHERRRLVEEFLDSIFEGVGGGEPTGLELGLRQAIPELPEEPTEEQIDAWIELAELIADEDFRERLRAMGRRSFGTPDQPARPPATPTGPEAMTTANLVTELAGAALAEGIDPTAPAATAIHDELVAAFAASVHQEPDEAYRRSCSSPWRPGTNPGPSVTGSCSPSSTAGRRLDRSCRTGPGSRPPSGPACRLSLEASGEPPL